MSSDYSTIDNGSNGNARFSAYYRNSGATVGYGPTRKDAIADLKHKMAAKAAAKARPTCEECGEHTDDDGECGECGNCGVPLCCHGVVYESVADKYDMPCDRWGQSAPNSGEPIPPPVDAVERAEWDRDMAILNADPRTAGQANRPAALVRQVLADAKAVR